MKKGLVVFLVIIIIGIIGAFTFYNVGLSPLEKTSGDADKKLVRVEIKEGMGISQIAELLEKEGLIRSADMMKIYSKLNRLKGLQAGKYDLSPEDDTKTIISQIVNGNVTDDSVKITFIEGKNMRYIAKMIAEKTTNTEEDVFKLLENENYIDSLIEKYWFITDEIKQKQIYYPLEGYLLPDTYAFKSEDISVKEIFGVILDFTEKFLNEYKVEIENNNLTVHQILTMASLAELEGKSLEDRKEIIGVFFNRLDIGMPLGSDVSTYYAFKVDMGDRDLTAKELNTENPYNTRGPGMNGKIPIGPICNPSKIAIEAALDYTETDAYYFVADKNGKVYFTKNNDEHIKMINKLKKEGLWYTYD